jgi:hypothetical protein
MAPGTWIASRSQELRSIGAGVLISMRAAFSSHKAGAQCTLSRLRPESRQAIGDHTTIGERAYSVFLGGSAGRGWLSWNTVAHRPYEADAKVALLAYERSAVIIAMSGGR